MRGYDPKIDDLTHVRRGAKSGQRLRRERNRGDWTPGWCQDDGMADILPFPQRRTPAPDREPEPLWREVLGRSLRAAREEQGGRLVDIAERAGISPQYLSEIERGRKEPSSEMIAAVTGALDLDLADLLAGIAGAVRQRHGAGLTITRRPAGPVLMAA
jgi:DNA-binding XRE family transcriptional regulator